MRLWAICTLGCAASGYGVPHPLYRDVVAPVLERALADDAVVPGWWPVRREAQAQLQRLHGSAEEDARLQAEIQTILSDSAASFEDKHWAGFYDRS